MVKKKVNDCPKAERCKYGAECINFDTFKGEYLCFVKRYYAENVRKSLRKGGEKHGGRRN